MSPFFLLLTWVFFYGSRGSHNPTCFEPGFPLLFPPNHLDIGTTAVRMEIPGKATPWVPKDGHDGGIRPACGEARKGGGFFHTIEREKPGPIGEKDGRRGTGTSFSDPMALWASFWERSLGGLPRRGLKGILVPLKAFDPWSSLFLKRSPKRSRGQFSWMELRILAGIPQKIEQTEDHQEDQDDRKRLVGSGHREDLTWRPLASSCLRQKRKEFVSHKGVGILA